MLFKLKTVSTFELVHIIRAGSLEEAEAKVSKEMESGDYYQRHLSEEVKTLEEVNVSEEELIKSLHEEEYW